MGLLGKIRTWLSEKESPRRERLAALVWQEEDPSGPWSAPPVGSLRGKLLYATDPRIAEDPIYLTRMAFHLQTVACIDREHLELPEYCVHNLLHSKVKPGFFAPLPEEVAGVEGVFLHDIEWRAADHPDWCWWQPNRGLRRIQLDAEQHLEHILPAVPGDGGRFARRRIRLLRSEGAREVDARLVQANSQLFSTAHTTDEPATVLFSEDPDADPAELDELAERLYEFRDSDETPDDLQEALAALRAGNEGWYYHRRARAQAGTPHFVADLFMPREFLRDGYLQDRQFRCLVEPGEEGGIELLPHNRETPPPDVTWERAWTAWNDRVVLQLAHAIAEDSQYADLPILGDALEEAGCGDSRIVEHCRADLPHNHNCWVVDGLIALGGRLG